MVLCHLLITGSPSPPLRVASPYLAIAPTHHTTRLPHPYTLAACCELWNSGFSPKPVIPPDPPPHPPPDLGSESQSANYRHQPPCFVSPVFCYGAAPLHIQIGLSSTAVPGHQIQSPAIQNRYGNWTLPLVSGKRLFRSIFPAHVSTITVLLSVVTTLLSAVDNLSTPARRVAVNPRSQSQLLHGPGPLELKKSLGLESCIMGFILMGSAKPKYKHSQQLYSKNIVLVCSSIAPIPDLLGSGLRWNKKSTIIIYIINVTSYAEKAIAQISAPRLQVFEHCEDSTKSFPSVKHLSNRIYLSIVYVIVIWFIVVSLLQD